MEFKESGAEATEGVYGAACALSKRDGGHTSHGIKDNGKIPGIGEGKAGKDGRPRSNLRGIRPGEVKKEFVASINNENEMYPPPYLTPVEHPTAEVLIIRLFPPNIMV